MVSPPRMLKLNTESVVNHYKALADAVDLPIVVQDYPPISGFAMEAGLLARIAREVPAARTIKLEDPPTPFKTARILAAAGETKVAILGGLGGVFLLEELLAGAAGVMTGLRVSGSAGEGRRALSRRPGGRGGRRVLPVRAADALRVPGRHRHGHPQGSVPAARRDRRRSTRAPGRRARRRHARGARSRARVDGDSRKAQHGFWAEGQGRDGRRREPRASATPSRAGSPPRARRSR